VLGAVECLEQETAPFNIFTHLIVLGQFRTPILDPTRPRKTPPKVIADYQKITDELTERHASTHGKQPGNPSQAVEKIIDIVWRKGAFSSDNTLPLRIALGSDAVDVMRAKCERTLAGVAEHEIFSKSTDFPEAGDVPSYWQV